MQITKSNERTLTYVRALVHGDSGVGKTTSIGTLPEKHTLVAVAERSIVPLRNKAFPVAQMDDWGALRTLVGELRKPFEVDGNEIRVLVLDSLTATSDLCKRQIIEVDRRALTAERTKDKTDRPIGIYNDLMTMEDWGLYAARMHGLVSALCHLPMHVIVTALSGRIENKKTGGVWTTVNLQGRFTWECPSLFDEVFSMESTTDTEGNPCRVWRTQHSNDTIAKDASGALDPFEHTNWTAVLKKIMGETNGKKGKQ